jgi:lipopolysaccharide biosynthesis glycosyltransferase
MPVASDVLAYSLKKYASVPLDISFLKKQDLSFNRTDLLASTEFTYTRFLVPSLCNYDGIALFMDNDMLCYYDIKEIFELDMANYALRVVKHDHQPIENIKMDGRTQTRYPRKNWSSFMLMDCSKLKCWTREAVETMPPAWLHRFEQIPDDQIGEIPFTWNVLDNPKEDTKLLHYTTGGPWFKERADCPGNEKWYRAYYDMMNGR